MNKFDYACPTSLAETLGLTPDDLAARTTENFLRLFSKVPRPAGARS
jgi:hypothetical protein